MHLGSYERPVDDRIGKRVPPSELLAYRKRHKFRAPCCLCAHATRSYTETAVCEIPSGEYVAEYVVRCSTDRCGYQSMFLLNLSRFTDILFTQLILRICMRAEDSG